MQDDCKPDAIPILYYSVVLLQVRSVIAGMPVLPVSDHGLDRVAIDRTWPGSLTRLWDAWKAPGQKSRRELRG